MSTISWNQLSTFTKMLAPWTISSTGQWHTGARIRTFSYKGLVLFIQEGFWLLSSLRKDCEGEGAPRGRAAEGVHQKIWPRQQASGTGQTQTGGLVCQPLRNTGNTVLHYIGHQEAVESLLKHFWGPNLNRHNQEAFADQLPDPLLYPIIQ